MNHRAEIDSAYRRPAASGKRGTVRVVQYPVNSYLDPDRRLVTNQAIDTWEAGRATVRGKPILKSCSVYVPAGYDDSDPDTKYEVVYLLHGVGGDHEEWLSGGEGKGDGDGGQSVLCNMLDNLIERGEIKPVIVVLPNGRSAHDWTDRSFNPEGTNMLGFYYFDYELRYDLIPYIESSFKTYADIRNASEEAIEYNRNHRAIAGLSMGGMQALNLILGGYRFDSEQIVGMKSVWGNGLVATVPAKGMTDLFAYVGAFSNAPTSSHGKLLGASVAAAGRKLRLLYLTCGDADTISFDCYQQAIDGLADSAGDDLEAFYQVPIEGGVHDFGVWHDGAYRFIRLAFGNGGVLSAE